MTAALRVLLSSSTNPWFNLAVEDRLFRELPPDQQVLLLWRNDPTVVIGRHQNPWLECNLRRMVADGVILAVGNRLPAAYQLRELLQVRYQQDFGVINARWIKPLPEEALGQLLNKVLRIITLEEGPRRGGYGAAVAMFLCENLPDKQLYISGTECQFIQAGDKETLSKMSGISAQQVADAVARKWSFK